MVDPRLLAAQRVYAAQQQAARVPNGRGVQVGSLVPLQYARQQGQANVAQQAAKAKMSETDLILSRGKKAAQPQGGGPFNAILGNSIVRGALKPLEVLDIPRRVTISGIQELADAINGGNASWSEFAEQAKDPSFGFGDVVGETGNKWLDRIIGFTGDVALDPLTYVTAGSSKLSGLGGRAALATAAAGSEKIAADQVGDLIRRIGTHGEWGLTGAEREILSEALPEVAKPGLKFRVPFGGERHIPGTGGLATAMGTGMGGARRRFTNTALGRTARKLGAGRDTELREAYEALARGGTSVMDPQAAANRIREVHANRGASRKLSSQTEVEAVDLGNKLFDNDQFTYAYEMGQATGEEADRLDALSKFLLDAQVKANVNVGDITQAKGAGVARYLPTIYTDEGMELLGHAPNNFPGAKGVDATAAEAHQMAREIKPGGRYEIGGKVFEPVTASKKEINDWSLANLNVKLVRDDPQYLIARMVEDASSAVGRAEGLNVLKTGAARELFTETDPRATRQVPVVNPQEVERVENDLAGIRRLRDATQTQTDVVGEQLHTRLIEQLTGMNQVALGADAQAQAAFKTAVAGAKDANTAQRALVSEANKLRNAAQREVDAAGKALKQAGDRWKALDSKLKGEGWDVYNAAVSKEMGQRKVLQKRYDDAVELVRQRDIVRKQLSRREGKLGRLSAADAELQASLEPRLAEVAGQAAEEGVVARQAAEAAVPEPAAVAPVAEAAPTPGVMTSSAEVQARGSPPLYETLQWDGGRYAAMDNGVRVDKVSGDLIIPRQGYDNMSFKGKAAIPPDAKFVWTDSTKRNVIGTFDSMSDAQAAVRWREVDQGINIRAAEAAAPQGVEIGGVLYDDAALQAQRDTIAKAQDQLNQLPVAEAQLKQQGKYTEDVANQIAQIKDRATQQIATANDILAQAAKAPQAKAPKPITPKASATPTVARTPVSTELQGQLGEIAGRQKAATKAIKTEGKQSAKGVREAESEVEKLAKRKGKLDTAFEEGTEQRLATKALLDQPVPGDNTAEAMRLFEDKANSRRASANRVTREAQDRHDKATLAFDALTPKEQADMAAMATVLSDAQAAKLATEATAAKTQAAVKQTTEQLKKAKKLPTSPKLGGDYEKLHQDLGAVANASNGFDTGTYVLLNSYGLSVAHMGRLDAQEIIWDGMLKEAKAGKLNPLFEAQALDGFEKIATSNVINGQDMYIRSEMARAMKSFKREVKREPGLLGKTLDQYTRFFKNWATSTPGFHVRNAISAIYMNLTEGVSYRQMLDGARIWKAFRDDPMGKWIEKLPAHLQPDADDVVTAVLGSGAGGRYTAAELGNRAFGERPSGWEKLSQNFITERSQNIGEKVEGSVRAGLALNAVSGGQDLNTAVMRIKRVHFDYSDVNEWDQNLRRVIPFWTFMSRNIPLQVQQMYLKPRTYLHYQSLKRNFNTDPDGEQFMPEYLAKADAFMIGGGTALAPDIGSNQLFEAVEDVSNPSRMLSNVNPAFQVPLQLATNRNFYFGSDYRPNDFVESGWETAPFMPALRALGMAESTEGGTAVERKYLDTLRTMLPFLGTTNRALATTEDRGGKEWQGIANFLGVPIKQISPEAERKNILYQRRQSLRQDPEAARQQALREFAATNR